MTEQKGFRLGNRGKWAGGAGLVTSLALGVALVGVSWANYSGARSAYDTLNRGRIDILEHTLRQTLGPWGEADSLLLAEALATHESAGVRYLAFIEGDGTVTAQAGTPAGPVVLPPSFSEDAREVGIVTEQIGNRVRAYLPRIRFGPPRDGDRNNRFGGRGGFDRDGQPGNPGGNPGVGGSPAAGRDGVDRGGPDGSSSNGAPGAGQESPVATLDSPGATAARVAESAPVQTPVGGDPPGTDRSTGGGQAGGGPAGPPPGTAPGIGNGGRGGPPTWASLLIEFEPLAASQLMSQAGRSLALGSFVAALLTLAAILFWRQSARHELARSEFEQRRRLSQLGEMSAIMAHEIRNPLASLKGNAQLLAEKLPAGTREKSKADRIVSEATRLEALTTDLLEFARSGPIEKTNTDPTRVLKAAIAEVGAGSFELDAAGAPRQWELDPKRLRYALVNVLQNALQASPSRAPTVRVTEEGGRLVYEVRDFGAGLPPGTEARLFDPFFTTRTTGTGLGLAVALRAAEFHGGTITASNHPEGGAVFRIVLPHSPN